MLATNAFTPISTRERRERILLHYCDGACQRHHSANRSNEKFRTLSHQRQRLDKLTSLPVRGRQRAALAIVRRIWWT
jgi:hypothetical protein